MTNENSYSIGGIKIRLLKTERNHHFLECKKCSTYMTQYHECPFISNDSPPFNIDPQKANCLIACYAVFQIINTTEDVVDAFEYYLYDTKARVYASHWGHPCEKIMRNRIYSYSSLKAQSINNVFVFFPELSINVDIARIAVNTEGGYLYFDINPVDKQTALILQQDQETKESLLFPYEEESLMRLNQFIPIIEIEINQLMDETRKQKEKSKLLDSISIHLNSIKSDLENIRPTKRMPFELRINNISSSLEMIRTKTQKRWEENLRYQRQAERLYYMSPREFELWCGRLFSLMGFEAEVTPYTGDEGIDIVLKKEGKTYGVQCKKYAEMVRYDEVAKLLYDCKKMNLDKCIFITTGFYNNDSIVFCKKHNIIFIDRFDLGELLQRLYESGKMEDINLL